MPDSTVHETEDLFRLYRTEWVIVHTVTGQGEIAQPFAEQAHAYGQETYGDRVLPEFLHLEANTDNAGSFWVHLKLLKPNMKGEFKYEHLAHEHARKQAWVEYSVVKRNSRLDHELRNYGTKKLS